MSVRLMPMATTAIIALAAAAPALARDQINIVGSSTVFPFSTTVAERFGKSTDFKTPIVESTGSGGGLKLFCAGDGINTPDITNASRRIKASEVALCETNGVTDIVEAKIGFDGIVMANSTAAEQVELSLRDIFLALAKDVPMADGTTQPNTYKTWDQINPSLPAVKIEVLGPPPTSGTRDAFVELAMEGGCKTFDWVKALKKSDKPAYKALCHTLREDGAYVEAGENDNLIVQKLEANPTAFGVFGYSFLEQNSDLVQGSIIDGVAPEFEDIAAGDYPIARSLYFYVKASHVGVVPGMAEFLTEFTSEDAWGEEGYLTDKGLIPLSEDERQQWSDEINALSPLSM
ncbi:PstS family phosphate ABC transporter substrate-binding protein [Parasedimentitalea marina]|uniref:PstS family phosphate ABC transporter substrate-binding protein n=1 Tax=Parasedimentitalea marina TaxID=2483033 RepID=A0A3T0MZF6_9RHOB|nr:PstS family phosphate ABC transporter substrate-binding protein [Parasedimentitalea marina]AZV77150.1 PstS family phosphate ABC transporter substrate-binding protein [Parasedimentitalea marina]